MAQTGRGPFRYPLGTDPPDTDGDIRRLAEDLAAVVALDSQGTLAARPAAGVNGRYYAVTSGAAAGQLFRDTGTSWTRIGADADTLDGLNSTEFLRALTEKGRQQITLSIPGTLTPGQNSALMPVAYRTRLESLRAVQRGAGSVTFRIAYQDASGIFIYNTFPGGVPASPNITSVSQAVDILDIIVEPVDSFFLTVNTVSNGAQSDLSVTFNAREQQ